MQQDFEKRIQRINARNSAPPPLPPKAPHPLATPKHKGLKSVLIGIAVTAVLLVGIGSTGTAFYSGINNLLGDDPKVSVDDFLSSDGLSALGSKMTKDAKMGYILNRYEAGKITKEEAVKVLTDAGIELR